MPAEFHLDLGDEETLDVNEVYPGFMQSFQARSARLNCLVLDTEFSGSENYSDLIVLFYKCLSKDMDIVCWINKEGMTSMESMCFQVC